MPIHLLSFEKCPPGSFRYDQPFNGSIKKFGSTPLIHELAARVADFRAANLLPRASKGEALEDIDAFTCQRLGNDPRFCYNTDKSINEIANLVPTAGCATCGKQHG